MFENMNSRENDVCQRTACLYVHLRVMATSIERKDSSSSSTFDETRRAGHSWYRPLTTDIANAFVSR